MKKSTLTLVGLVALSVAGVSLYMRFTETKGPAIAIFLTLSHPALNDVREGFIEKLKEVDPKYVIRDYNAQGSIQQANVIAREIALNDDIKMVLAIGTLAAQTMAKIERERPIIIAAVSNPQGVRFKEGGDNVCGLGDAPDADYQIATLLGLIPTIKTLALLHSPHEGNSAFMVKKLEAAAMKRGVQVSLVGVLEPQQIPNASQSACQNSDAVLIPLDNQLVASMAAVIKATKQYSCPIITTNVSPIYQGASIAFGVDYLKMGHDAAALVLELQDKKSPSEIGFLQADDIKLYSNMRVLKEKGLSLTETANQSITKVEE